MRVFTCGACKQVVFFENVQCTRCGLALAFLPDRSVMSALEPAGDDGALRALSGPADARYRRCANGTQHGVCNWAAPEGQAGADGLCRACAFNDTIPDL